jgi:hypothetical protein
MWERDVLRRKSELLPDISFGSLGTRAVDAVLPAPRGASRWLKGAPLVPETIAVARHKVGLFC